MGNAVVPYLTPYRETEVSLRSDSLNNQVDLDTASVNVVPTRGAIVRARFDTRVGYRVLMNLTQANGKAVPFGATATLLDTTKESSSIVGEDGQLYISGMHVEKVDNVYGPVGRVGAVFGAGAGSGRFWTMYS